MREHAVFKRLDNDAGIVRPRRTTVVLAGQSVLGGLSHETAAGRRALGGHLEYHAC